MKRLILALLCAVPVFAQTVDQTVAIALKNNANIQNAQLEIEKAEERVSAAKTKRLPKFELQAIGREAMTNLLIEIDNGSAGPPNGEKTRVDLARTFNTIAVARITQPLTQLHSIRLGVQLNETAVKANKEQERAARLAITREVKSAYYAVLSARGYAHAMKAAVTAAEEGDQIGKGEQGAGARGATRYHARNEERVLRRPQRARLRERDEGSGDGGGRSRPRDERARVAEGSARSGSSRRIGATRRDESRCALREQCTCQRSGSSQLPRGRRGRSQ